MCVQLLLTTITTVDNSTVRIPTSNVLFPMRVIYVCCVTRNHRRRPRRRCRPCHTTQKMPIYIIIMIIVAARRHCCHPLQQNKKKPRPKRTFYPNAQTVHTLTHALLWKTTYTRTRIACSASAACKCTTPTATPTTTRFRSMKRALEHANRACCVVHTTTSTCFHCVRMCVCVGSTARGPYNRKGFAINITLAGFCALIHAYACACLLSARKKSCDILRDCGVGPGTKKNVA